MVTLTRLIYLAETGVYGGGGGGGGGEGGRRFSDGSLASKLTAARQLSAR